ncbi:MAG: hypothetical protein OEZ38_05285 [Gammaproteobacteria bacterium]|nr:hypothetical protein [Gammaproteobacteria bacterium]
MGFKLGPVTTDDDKKEILNLWSRNLPSLSEKRLNWFYELNPVGNSQTIKATTEDGDVIGSGSFFLQKLKVGNQVYKISTASDFSIDEKYRLFGPALSIQKELVRSIKDNQDLFCGLAFPNKSGKGVFLRSGYIHLSDAEFWSIPLSSLKFWKSRINNSYASLFLSLMADIFIRVFFKVTIKSLPGQISFSEIDSFDNKINELWARTNTEYDITTVRDSLFLNWRYINNPVDKYKVYVLKNANQYLGYVVFKEVDSYYEIVDLYSENSIRTYTYIIQCMIRLAINNNMSSVCLSFVGNDKFKKVLKKNFFRLSSLVKRPLLILTENENIINSSRWYIYEGDMDL